MTPGFRHYLSSIFKKLESRGDNECDAKDREAWLDCVCVCGGGGNEHMCVLDVIGPVDVD